MSIYNDTHTQMKTHESTYKVEGMQIDDKDMIKGAKDEKGKIEAPNIPGVASEALETRGKDEDTITDSEQERVGTNPGFGEDYNIVI